VTKLCDLKPLKPLTGVQESRQDRILKEQEAASTLNLDIPASIAASHQTTEETPTANKVSASIAASKINGKYCSHLSFRQYESESYSRRPGYGSQRR
jgi:hypothetical protein